MIDSDRPLLKSASIDVIISNYDSIYGYSQIGVILQILRYMADLLLSNRRPFQSEEQMCLYLVT